MPILLIDMNTDDDCEILYNGESYCHYGPNLVISKEFDTVQEAVCFLISKITIGDGKIQDWLKAWYLDVCQCLLDGEAYPNSLAGNQDCSISFS